MYDVRDLVSGYIFFVSLFIRFVCLCSFLVRASLRHFYFFIYYGRWLYVCLCVCAVHVFLSYIINFGL